MTGETIRNKSVSKVDSYFFTFDPVGWAIAYVDDERGALSIVSDWGNFSYVWGTRSLGAVSSFSEFLTHAGVEYVSTKLHVDHKGILDIDEKATKEALKKELLRMRRDEEIEGWEARHEWNELESWDPDFDSIPPISFVDNWWDYRQTGYKQSHVFLKDVLIPALQAAIRETGTMS